MGLALLQLIVQLICFMHVGQEEEPRWKLLVFDFTLVVIVIVVFGTLWIMGHLDHSSMTPQETKTYMHEHEGF
jgi:cytochrome o ubiquinol oxidase operon protein cyoD